MKRRLGGDHWYNARAESLNFRVAAALHRLGQGKARAVATVCGIRVQQAYDSLLACARRPHLYHLRRLPGGRFVSLR